MRHPARRDQGAPASLAWAAIRAALAALRSEPGIEILSVERVGFFKKRLERMLESAERERFDLSRVVSGCVEGYRAAGVKPVVLSATDLVPSLQTGMIDCIAERVRRRSSWW